MATITTRASKGSGLTNQEIDQNFTNFNNDILVDNYGTLRPNLNLNFCKAKTLDPVVSFQRSTVATRVNPSGLLEQISTNQPRFEFNPVTREPKGLLIEEQRTNLLNYTNLQPVNSWSPVNAYPVRIPNQTAPDGTLSAFLFDDQYALNDGSGIEQQAISITASSTTNYCLSVFVKQGTAAALDLYAFFYGNSTKGSAIRYTFASGVITPLAADGGGIIPTIYGSIAYPNGWIRIYFVVNDANNGLNNLFQYRIYPAARDTGFTGSTYIWGAQLEVGSFPTSYIPSALTFSARASVGTYIDSTGIVQTAATGTARFSYNPDNLFAQPYLLLEEQRTNFVRNNFTDVNFGTISTGTAIAPDGTVARKFVPSAGTVFYPTLGSTNGVNFSNSTTFTAAVSASVDIAYTGYFAATGPLNYKPYIVIEFNTNNSANSIFANYLLDVNAGTIASSSVMAPIITLTSATLVKDIKGMYKFSVVIRYIQDATARNNINTRVMCADQTNNTSSYTADGTSGFEAALLQCEIGSYPTSYIPTTGASATRIADTILSSQTTRTADQVSISNLTPWYNSIQGTLYAEFIGTAVTTNTFPTVLGIRPAGDTGSNTTIELYLTQNNINGLVRVQFVSTQASLSPTVTITNANKAALTYKTNDFAMSANGGTVVTDAVGILPSNLTQARIGYNAGNQYLNGCVKCIMYYPLRLSNVQLQALTAL